MPFQGLRYAIPAILLTSALSAQTPSGPTPSTQYWLTAGAGYANLSTEFLSLGFDARSTALAVSAQHGAFVSSIRWIDTRGNDEHAWDLGLLAGAGTPSRYAFRGSIGAGLGLAHDTRGNTGVTVPLELQLGWRFTSWVGAGTYLFTNLGGPSQSLGAAVGLQIGKLR